MAKRDWAPSWRVVILANITLLALCLRVYRLDEQSVWFDEFNTILIDPSASLATFMRHIRIANPDHVPLFFLLMFAWGKYVSASALSMRFLSVVFGCLAVPMVYRIGRDLSSGKAGLVAALCLALSPINIHFSQEIRCNAFLAYLAAVSIWMTLRIAKRPTWYAIAAQAALNTLMVFTHLTAAFLVLFEFAFLLLSAAMLAGPDGDRRDGPVFRVPGKAERLRLLLWAGLHAPSALQCLYWMRQFGGVGGIWFALPKPVQWLTDLLGDDAVRQSQEFAFTMLGPITEQVQRDGLRPIVEDAAYLAVMLAAVIWGVVRLVRRADWRGDNAARTQAVRGLFTLLLLAGPLVSITLISVLWHPVALPRYTLYSSFALYVLVGEMAMGLRTRKRRALAVLVVVGVYLPQLGIVLPNFSRPDWKGVGRIIQENSRKGDLLLALRRMPDDSMQIPQPAELITYNMEAPKLHFVTAYAYKGVLDQCARFLGPDEGPDSVWLVVDPYNGFLRRTKLEKRFAEHKLAFTHWQTTNIHVYKIWRQDVESVADPGGKQLEPLNEDLMRTYMPDCGKGPESTEALEALRWAVPRILGGSDDPFYLCILGLRAMELSPATGRAMAERVLKTDPTNVPALFLLNFAAIALGDVATAKDAFQRIPPAEVALDSASFPGLDAFMVGDFATARATAREFCALAPSRMPPFFRYALGMEKPPLGSHLVALP